MIRSFITPKAFAGTTRACGRGVFASKPVQKHERIAVFGGHVIGVEEFFELSQYLQDRSFQIDTDLMFAYLSDSECGCIADLFNHSCEPNAGWNGMIELIAMRDIRPFEEICFDYATCLAIDFGSMPCCCEASSCRGQVTGNDWKNLAVQEINNGYFQPFIARRITEQSNIANTKARE